MQSTHLSIQKEHEESTYKELSMSNKCIMAKNKHIIIEASKIILNRMHMLIKNMRQEGGEVLPYIVTDIPC